MAMEGGMKCVKYLVFLFNFIFWLCGVALIVVGVLVQMSLHNTYEIDDPSASGGPIIIAAVGVIIFFIAGLGCCGAWKENSCMVTSFAALLLMVIIIEIGAAIAGYVFRNKVTAIVRDSLADMVENYGNSSAEFKASVAKLQEELQCCGLNNSTDWMGYNNDQNSVPDSCCRVIFSNCGIGAMNDNAKVYTEGCRDTLELLLKNNVLWLIVAALVIAFLQVMGVLLACLLRNGIRKGYEVM